MPGLKEIRRRIGTVKSTKQITRAMKLVSAAKLKRSQDLVAHGREFSSKLVGIVDTIKADMESREAVNSAFVERESIKARLVIVFSADRGLCGPYNSNLVKSIYAQESDQQRAITKYILLGRKATAAFRRARWHADTIHEGLGDNPVSWPLDQIAQNALSSFLKNEVDEVVVYYTGFVSGLSQKAVRERILPISGARDTDSASHAEPLTADASVPNVAAETLPTVKYSPSAEQLLAGLIPMLVCTKLKQAAFEAKASEHAARMTAMDSATHNADELIYKLQLFYNRARQSAITRELIEVLGGAEAIK